MVEPAGHYQLAVQRQEWVYLAGQTGEDEAGALGDLRAQTRQAIANISNILRAHGGTLSHVVRMTCFLRDISEFAVFDDAYRSAMGGARPSRSTVGVTGLPMGELVEIEATAFIPLDVHRPDR